MAEQWGFQINSSLASQHLTDAKYVQGGYIVVATEADRDALPVKTGDTAATDGVVVNGSLVYVSDDSKAYRWNGTAWCEESSGGVEYKSGPGISIEKDTTKEITVVDEPTELYQNISSYESGDPIDTTTYTDDNLKTYLAYELERISGKGNNYYVIVLPNNIEYYDTVTLKYIDSNSSSNIWSELTITKDTTESIVFSDSKIRYYGYDTSDPRKLIFYFKALEDYKIIPSVYIADIKAIKTETITGNFINVNYDINNFSVDGNYKLQALYPSGNNALGYYKDPTVDGPGFYYIELNGNTLCEIGSTIRKLSVYHDTTLAEDNINHLHVNTSALIDDDTVKLNNNGKIYVTNTSTVSSVNDEKAISGNIILDSKHVPYIATRMYAWTNSDNKSTIYTIKETPDEGKNIYYINDDNELVVSTSYVISDVRTNYIICAVAGMSFSYDRDAASDMIYDAGTTVYDKLNTSVYSGGTGISITNNAIGLSLTDAQKAIPGMYIYNAQASGWSNITFTNSFSSTYTDTSMSSINVGLTLSANKGITLNNNLFKLSLTNAQLDNNYYYGYNPKNDNWTPVATSANVGALSELTTTNKTSIVSAINSVYGTVTANAVKIGSISAAMGNQVTYSLSGTTLTITSK